MDKVWVSKRAPPANVESVKAHRGIAIPTDKFHNDSDTGDKFPSSPPSDDFIYIPDATREWPTSEDSMESPISSPKQLERSSKRSKTSNVWNPILEGNRRILSQGDLRFQLNMEIVAVLPFYFDCNSNDIRANYAVQGTIIDIHSVKTGNLDIPRETKLRSSPISNLRSLGSVDLTWSKFEGQKNKLSSDLDWAKPMISTAGIPKTEEDVQTIVTSYVIKLHEDQILDNNMISKLNIYVLKNSKLPYKFDLNFKQNEEGVYDTITIHYRYLMGSLNTCLKHAKLMDPNIKKGDIDDINKILSSYKISSGTAIEYSDSDPSDPRAHGRISRFITIDHICAGAFDIRYVIKPLDPPTRILAITKLSDFDVRGHYSVENYYCFHPLDRYHYTIERSYSDNLNKIRDIIRGLFSSLKVYIVKKSLRRQDESEQMEIFEDAHGNFEFAPAHSKIPGFKHTGIVVGNYVKGLAYPEKEPPNKNNEYIFFDSKDYCDLDLNPYSPTFMELMELTGPGKMYRDPLPKDVLLGQIFKCDRQNFKGKTNLKWFYPSESMRMLHFAVTNANKSFENHPSMNRQKFTGISLNIFDLWKYGSSKRNKTLRSEFSTAFMKRYLWKALLEADLDADPNYDYLTE